MSAAALPRLSSFLERRGRFLLALLSLGLAALVAATWQSDELDRGLLLARARSAGLSPQRQEALAAKLEREADAGERRIVLTRALFAARRSKEGDASDPLRQRIVRLETIESVASEALAPNRRSPPPSSRSIRRSRPSADRRWRRCSVVRSPTARSASATWGAGSPSPARSKPPGR